jgi:hypothetical protein
MIIKAQRGRGSAPAVGPPRSKNMCSAAPENINAGEAVCFRSSLKMCYYLQQVISFFDLLNEETFNSLNQINVYKVLNLVKSNSETYR